MKSRVSVGLCRIIRLVLCRINRIGTGAVLDYRVSVGQVLEQ